MSIHYQYECCDCGSVVDPGVDRCPYCGGIAFELVDREGGPQ